MREVKSESVAILGFESIATESKFEDLPEIAQELWRKRYAYEEAAPALLYEERAPLHAEFSRIAVLGVGFLSIRSHKPPTFQIHMMEAQDEPTLLRQLADTLPPFPEKRYSLCVHNGIEFGYPYLCKRFFVHQLAIPYVLQVRHQKPWQREHLKDTMQLWNFGSRKSSISLRLLAYTLNLNPSQEFMKSSGRARRERYLETKNLEEMHQFCLEKMFVTAQVYLKLHHLPILEPKDMEMES